MTDPRYVNSLRSDCRYKYGILETCEQLRMDSTGALEGMSEEDRIDRIEWLRYRMANWKPSLLALNEYDNTVLQLIRATLREICDRDARNIAARLEDCE